MTFFVHQSRNLPRLLGNLQVSPEQWCGRVAGLEGLKAVCFVQFLFNFLGNDSLKLIFCALWFQKTPGYRKVDGTLTMYSMFYVSSVLLGHKKKQTKNCVKKNPTLSPCVFFECQARLLSTRLQRELQAVCPKPWGGRFCWKVRGISSTMSCWDGHVFPTI